MCKTINPPWIATEIAGKIFFFFCTSLLWFFICLRLSASCLPAKGRAAVLWGYTGCRSWRPWSLLLLLPLFCRWIRQSMCVTPSLLHDAVDQPRVTLSSQLDATSSRCRIHPALCPEHCFTTQSIHLPNSIPTATLTAFLPSSIQQRIFVEYLPSACPPLVSRIILGGHFWVVTKHCQNQLYSHPH